MLRKLLITCFFFTLGNLESLRSLENARFYSRPLSSCEYGQRPIRFTFRHIEGKGVGYNRGYTTLECFFSPAQLLKNEYMPFLDLRGHLFNNGKTAANAGIGMRYLGESRVWGANAYYDYRRITRRNFNQFSMGLESLGTIFDFYLSGYLPIGKKTGPFSFAKFERFEGHYMILSSKSELALKGADARIGIHIDRFKNKHLYFSAGPYYLNGKGNASFGGKMRASIDFFNMVRLEAAVSYDKIFKWRGQGQAGVNILSFGTKRKLKPKNSTSHCLALTDRSLQPAYREEIIPLLKQNLKTKAIDPATGEPYFFWFVDNTSSSLGTFESPFPTLAQAQDASLTRDIIYVFSGDGTDLGMDGGITLKNYQKLFGSGVYQYLPTTLGTIKIPQYTTNLPHITSLSNVVVLANNNEISGVKLQTTLPNTNAIIGTNKNNVNVHDNHILVSPTLPGGTNIGILFSGTGFLEAKNNLFECTTLSWSQGIRTDFTGSLSGIMSNNSVNNFLYGLAVNNSSTASSSFALSNNIIRYGRSGGADIFLTKFAASIAVLTVSNNVFVASNLNNAIATFLSGGSSSTSYITIHGNTFSNYTVDRDCILHQIVSRNYSTITNNTFTNNLSAWFGLHMRTTAATSFTCLTLRNNTVATGLGYKLDNSAGGTFNLAPLVGNTGSMTQLGVITSVNSCSN